MKKSFYGITCCLIFILTACGGGNQQKVKSFIETFADYVNADQLDSIKAVYPSVNFDSVSPISTDSVKISDTDGITRVDFASGKWIEIQEGEDGNLMVVASKGIAAFPERKYQLGIMTGMITDSISDTKIQKLINDSTYFDWLKNKVQKEFQEGLSITVVNKTGRMLGEGLFEKTQILTIKNNTDHDIFGRDYEISYNGIGNNDSEIGGTYKISKGMQGVDVKAGQTTTQKLSSRGLSMKNPVAILTIPIEEYIIGNYKPTGKEYQEYLDSKK